MRELSLRCIAPAAVVALLACGVTQPKYIDYKEEDDGTGTGGGTAPATGTATGPATGTATGTETGTATGNTADPCALAQAEFDLNIQSSVSSTCVGCHAVTTIATKALNSTDSVLNRAQLAAYAAGSVDKLFNKYSATGETHGGGPLGSVIPKDKLTAWLTKEAACTP